MILQRTEASEGKDGRSRRIPRSVDQLEGILRSLGSVVWTFNQSTKQRQSLTTSADNIKVTLTISAVKSRTALAIEGVLREAAALIVVATG
ncbi:hypothetical protein [Paraburkholderia aromaticivorans]|uniref:hypothetical protein n=1 Tax=Paraburkholderia aromaticivorans TaxID=2026199 RepID=UPI001455F9B0|nr:hypothetical protein [Paraburkholderia aromaticivorans]